MKIKNFAILLTAAALILQPQLISVKAGGPAAEQAYIQAAAELPEGIDAESVYVCETQGGETLYEKNSDEKKPMGHFAKLMAVLLAAESLESGKLSLDDTVTVSANANSKQGTQIWLDAGEKISAEELIKSITIGNANDAAAALGEHMYGSEQAFIDAMNKRAKQLKMKDTKFADCCGTDKNSVTTAKDLAVLCSELAKHNDFTDYFLTWIDNVRGQAVELVSTNRLVRTYKGLKGGKSCAPEGTGESLAVWANKGDMSVCAVLIGCKSDDDKFSQASDLLDSAFAGFRLFSPEIDKKFCDDISVTGGEKLKVSVKLKSFSPAVVPAGSSSRIECRSELKDSLKAPVKKGTRVGRLVYSLDGKDILTVETAAAEAVGRMTYTAALKKSLCNLFNLKH